jgi:hypothetical protein
MSPHIACFWRTVIAYLYLCLFFNGSYLTAPISEMIGR